MRSIFQSLRNSIHQLFQQISQLARRIWLFLNSVRFRLTLWFVLILAIILVVFAGFVYSRQARDLRSAALDRLLLTTRQLANIYRVAGLFYSPDGQLHIPDIINNLFNSNDENSLLHNDIVLFIDSQGQVVQRVGPVSDSDIKKLAQLEKSQLGNDNPLSLPILDTSVKGNPTRQEYLFAMAAVPVSGNNLGVLILGIPVDPTGQLHQLILTLILGGLATLAIALAGGYWLASRAMHPVQIITHAAREIGETDLSRRLNINAPDELGELANTFDQMLARLQAAFNRQRQFTADASHELRTPLTIVNLETDHALATRRSPEEYERALAVIQSENEFMIRLVNDLLTLARMDAGQAVLKPERLDLSDIALEVVERLTPLAERNLVKLSTGELPEIMVWGDRQYLSQMISNLVENAIKYTEAPVKCVQVETGRHSVNGNTAQACVLVEDNGPGIAPEHLARLFDRFYRVDKARTHNEEDGENPSNDPGHPSGSGLGLSIVQWVAKAHGGQVIVKSEVGKGSTFEISLPLADDGSDEM